MDQVGYNDTRSITLPAGNKCTIEVDATEFVARVLFEPYTEYSSQEIGLLWEGGYQLGDQVTVKMGDSQQIILFNGQQGSSARIKVTFTGAERMAAGIIALAASLINFM